MFQNAHSFTPKNRVFDVSAMFLVFHVLDLTKCNALGLRTNFTCYNTTHSKNKRIAFG